MAKLFNLEISTPYRLFFTGQAEAIVVSLVDGEIGIYADHAFIAAPVVTGILKIKDKSGTWKTVFTTEGLLEVSGHRTLLLVDAAEWPEEIDQERALAAKQRAEEQIRGGASAFELENIQASLKRAETRLKAYGMRAGG